MNANPNSGLCDLENKCFAGVESFGILSNVLGSLKHFQAE